MKDADSDSDSERANLRQMIADAVEVCTDTFTLDLVYKLLLTSYENKDDHL